MSRNFVIAIIFLTSFVVVEPMYTYVSKHTSDLYYLTYAAYFSYIILFNLIPAFYISNAIYSFNRKLGIILYLPVTMLLICYMVTSFIIGQNIIYPFVKTSVSIEKLLPYFSYTLLQLTPLIISRFYFNKILKTVVPMFLASMILYLSCILLSNHGIGYILDNFNFSKDIERALSIIRLRYYLDIYFLLYSFNKLESFRKADLEATHVFVP